jgi:hypothetical protein
VIGATLETFEVKGLIVDAIFDEEVEPFPNIVHHDHYPVDLGKTWTSIASFATFDGDPSRKGAISVIYLEPAPGRATLQPNGVVRIARMVVSVRVPEDETRNEVVIRYVDGFRTRVSRPVNNVITWARSSIPVTGDECRFTVRRGVFTLELGFDGCPPDVVEGALGELKTFEVFLTLTTWNQSAVGADSWAISLGIDGGAVRAIDVKGILVSTSFDDDGDPATPPLDPHYLDLGTASKWDADVATSAGDPSRAGAISMVVLGPEKRVLLQPSGIQRIAKVLVEARIPEDGTEREVLLRYEDGFRTSGSPRQNHVNIGDYYADPELAACRFVIRAKDPDLRVPGDADQSGRLDLADAVRIFTLLFQGIPRRFPCGDGSPEDSGNRALLDWQPDGAIDLSDGIATLQFLFLGGAAHHRAIPEKELTGCVLVPGCVASTLCRR